MSNSAFARSRPILATATAARCALLKSAADRELLWFIQGLSLEQGGIDALAAELLGAFPERIGTPTLIKVAGKGRTECSGKEAAEIRSELMLCRDSTWDLLSRDESPAESITEDWEDDAPRQHAAAAAPAEPIGPLLTECRRRAAEQLPDFLIELCINPEIDLADCGVPYFQDLAGALRDYKRTYEERAKEDFCLTAIGRQIWAQLDDARRSRSMILIDGREGRGKTMAVKAWCACHLGLARFASLKGISTKTAQFRELARALGVSHSNTRAVSEMQVSVEDVLKQSGLMVIFDEAHFFFNQGKRIYTRPEMLDWVDTALCNPASPVALITTPQFLLCMEKAAAQTGWNWRQFRRRCKRTVTLPSKNSHEDLERVARKLLPGASNAAVKMTLGYEAMTERDVSAIGDVASEARALAAQDGSDSVTFDHVKRAIHEVLIPSDVPWAEMEKRLKGGRPRVSARTVSAATEMHSEGPRALAMPPGRLVAPQADSGRFSAAERSLVGSEV